jgi:hypothetical protein
VKKADVKKKPKKKKTQQKTLQYDKASNIAKLQWML